MVRHQLCDSRVLGSGFRVRGSEFGIQGLGFGVQGPWFGGSGSGKGVSGDVVFLCHTQSFSSDFNMCKKIQLCERHMKPHTMLYPVLFF